MRLLEWAFVVIVAPMWLFVAYALFVWAPVDYYAQAECLRAGYPKHYVTVGLERYCATLDGAVTVRVDKMSSED